MTIQIPCDTIARLSRLLPDPNDDIEPIFRTMRLDNGRVIVTNRKFAAVEILPNGFTGVHHIALPDDLIRQCISEAVMSSQLLVTPNPMIGWTSASTTGGHTFVQNIGVFPTEETTFDKWYERMVTPCLTPLQTTASAMVVDAVALANLAASSPSGTVVFELTIDAGRTTVLRDAHDHRWVGFFMPRLSDGMYYPPAAVPSWLRQV